MIMIVPKLTPHAKKGVPPVSDEEQFWRWAGEIKEDLVEVKAGMQRHFDQEFAENQVLMKERLEQHARLAAVERTLQIVLWALALIGTSAVAALGTVVWFVLRGKGA